MPTFSPQRREGQDITLSDIINRREGGGARVSYHWPHPLPRPHDTPTIQAFLVISQHGRDWSCKSREPHPTRYVVVMTTTNQIISHYIAELLNQQQQLQSKQKSIQVVQVKIEGDSHSQSSFLYPHSHILIPISSFPYPHSHILILISSFPILIPISSFPYPYRVKDTVPACTTSTGHHLSEEKGGGGGREEVPG